jgi:hypothetical protein
MSLTEVAIRAARAAQRPCKVSDEKGLYGKRLNIRKATLRGWRQEFARRLRALGEPANATERAVRGENRSHKLDGIYQAAQRGESWRVRSLVQEVSQEIFGKRLRNEPGKETLTGRPNARGKVSRTPTASQV